MTNDQISAMQSGKELDALVAKILFNGQTITKSSKLSDRKLYALVGGEEQGFVPLEKGKTLLTAWWRHTEEQAWDACPHYSTDISAAWEVVEKMREQDYGFVIGNDDQDIVAQFIAPYNIGFYRDDKDLRVEAKTAPEAICKAALLALMKESEKE